MGGAFPLAQNDPERSAWLEQAQRILAQALSPRRECLRYAIGKYFDDVEDFDLAFNYFRANELTKRDAEHDRRNSTRPSTHHPSL